MHGKNGNPNSFIGGLAGSLSSAGAIVETPEMPWSHLRRYDVDFETAMKEIDEAVATLRSKGARRIIVAGHSMGALGAVGYAARYEGLSGVIGIAPGHAASGGFQKHIGDDDFIKARKMVARGEGNSYSYFDDWNNNVGGQVSLHTTANVYISYFDPDGPGTYAKNIPNMKPGYPTLVVYGDRDNTAYAFNGTSHPKSDVIVIPSTHLGAPSDGVDVIASWLRSLECKKPWCGNSAPEIRHLRPRRVGSAELHIGRNHRQQERVLIAGPAYLAPSKGVELLFPTAIETTWVICNLCPEFAVV